MALLELFNHFRLTSEVKFIIMAKCHKCMSMKTSSEHLFYFSDIQILNEQYVLFIEAYVLVFLKGIPFFY